MRWDSVGEEDLEDAELQHVRESPLEALHGPPGDVLERGVERAPPLHGAEREVHGERAVAGVELGLLGLARERAVGVGALVEDARDHAQRERAGCAHGAVTEGSAPRSPRSQSAAGMRRPPGGCSSRISSPPVAQPSTRTPSASTSAPGAGPSACAAVRQISVRCAVEREPRADVRRERAHDVVQRSSGPRGVEQAVGGDDLGRIGRLADLRHRREGAARGVGERSCERRQAERE